MSTTITSDRIPSIEHLMSAACATAAGNPGEEESRDSEAQATTDPLATSCASNCAAPKMQHQKDRRAGVPGVWLPEALERKYPNAGTEFGWFWLFPSYTLSTDPRSGVVRRHHISDSVIQRAVKAAATSTS